MTVHLGHLHERMLTGVRSGDVSPRRQRLGLLAITIAAFFMAADVTITNVALPKIALDLDASMSSLQWVVDSYNIAVAGLLLLGAGIGERYSRKWAFLGGILLFLAGSLGAGLSTSVDQLVAARTVMGIGGALVVAPAISLIAAMFAPDQRARAIAAWAAAGSMGLALSPIAGGFILSFASWHWVFLVNVPVMAATVLLGAVAIPNSRSPDAHRLDVVGALLSVAGLVLFLGAIIEAPSAGWGSPLVLGGGVSGIVVLTAFVLWELRTPHPMFEVRVLTRRGVLGASLALFASYVAFAGSLFLVAQQLHVIQRVTSVQLGLCLAPFAVALWLASRRASAVAARIGPVRTLAAGMVVLVAAFALLGTTAVLDSIPLIIVGMILVGLGCGLLIPIGSVVILNDLPESLTGSASGTSMLARFAGASFGVAVLGTVLAVGLPVGNAHADPTAFAHGVALAYIAGTGILVVLGIGQSVVLRHWRPPRGG